MAAAVKTVRGAATAAFLCAALLPLLRCSNPKKPGVTENPEVEVEIVTAAVTVAPGFGAAAVSSVLLEFYNDGAFVRNYLIADMDAPRTAVPAADVGGTGVSLIAEGRNGAGDVVCYGYLDIGLLHPEESTELTAALDWVSLRPATSDLPAKYINGVCVAPDNTVWAATDSSGVCRYDGSAWRVYGIGNGLPDARMLAVWCDRAGRIWAGTEGGAYLKAPQDNIWAAHDSLPGVAVHCFAETGDSILYFGTNEGLYRMGASGRWSKPLDGDYTVLDIAPTAGDSVWCATSDNGLVLVTDSLEAAYGTADGLPAVQAFSVCLAGDGRVWVATSGGLAAFDGTSFATYGQGTFDRNGMQAVGASADGVLWTASPFTVYANRGSAWQGYPVVVEDQHLHHLYVDARNYKWFSTRGKGILLYTGS